MEQKVVRNRFSELLAIKERKLGHTITQREIAAETGISLSSISSFATQKVTRFDSEIIARLCDFFECTVGELLVIEVISSEDTDEKEGLPAA